MSSISGYGYSRGNYSLVLRAKTNDRSELGQSEKGQSEKGQNEVKVQESKDSSRVSDKEVEQTSDKLAVIEKRIAGVENGLSHTKSASTEIRRRVQRTRPRLTL